MQRFSLAKLAAAYSADLLFGDPHWMPHPVRVMGAAVRFGENRCRPRQDPAGDFARGAALSALLTCGSYCAAEFLVRRSAVAEVALAWTTLATGSLLAEAGSVVGYLQAAQIEQARGALSMIVGRDTNHLDESEIARAVIETLAESLCDGIASPLLYLACGGVPLAMAYKAVSTLDSMIGHPEPPYTYFGRFAARADDAANFLPARTAALAIVLAAAIENRTANAWRTWLRDGGKHPSPNAGQCEAAMAGALGVQLGGTNYYSGNPCSKPLLGAGNRRPTVDDTRRALKLTRIGSLLISAVALGICKWRSAR